MNKLNQVSLQESILKVHWLIDNQMEPLIGEKSFIIKDSKYVIDKSK